MQELIKVALLIKATIKMPPKNEQGGGENPKKKITPNALRPNHRI